MGLVKRLVCLTVQRFRKKSLLFAVILSLAAAHFQCLSYLGGPFSKYAVEAVNPSMVNTMTLSYSLVPFLFCLFIGYELSEGIRAENLQEVWGTGRNGLGRVVLAHLLVLAGFAFLLTLQYGGYNLYACLRYQGATAGYGLNLLGAHLLYLFLPCFAACLMGTVLALFAGRYTAYGVMVLIGYLSSSLFAELLEAVNVFGGRAAGRLLTLFTLPHQSRMILDEDYGFGLEGYRFFRVAFWLLLLAGLLWLGCRMRRRWPALLCGGLAVLCVGGFFFRGSALVREDGPDRTSDVLYFYYSENPVRNQPADFAVRSCDLKLKITDRLKGTATLAVEKNEVGADCRFTLYHGYKLTSLTDGAGDPLEYKREGDYLTVYPPAGERLEELVFQYRGEGGLSYSNRQAVFLPAGFGYYPLEGWVPLYEENEVPFAAVGAEKDFTLQVSASCPLEVSLPPAEKGYAGRTQGVTLLGGLVIRGDCGGMELVSASLSHRMGNIFWDEYQSRLDAAAQLGFDFSDKLKDKPVFLTDQSDWANYTPFVEFSDHYLCRVPPTRWVADEFVHQALADAPEKEKVAQTAILLLDERTRKAFEVNCVGAGLPEPMLGVIDLDRCGGWAVVQPFGEAVFRLGEEPVIAQVKAYLADGTGTRTALEFLNDLRRGAEG